MRSDISKSRIFRRSMCFTTLLFICLYLDTSKFSNANEITRNIGKLSISSFYLRGTIQGRPAAAYMTIHNSGDKSDSLISAYSPMASIIDFHETRVESAVAKMRQVPLIGVEPNSVTVLKPGGLHLMVKELKTPPISGKVIPISLKFKHAGVIEINFPFKTYAGVKIDRSSKKIMDHKNH